MARRWVNLVGVTPLLLGMMVAVPLMVVAPLVLAQSSQTNQISQSSQATEAQSLYTEGEQLRRRGTRESLQQALAKFQQALPLFRVSGDRNGEADNLDSIGLVYSRLGQAQLALNFYQQALPLWRAVGNSIEERLYQRSGEASTLNNIGNVYLNVGQPQQALNYYQQALIIYRESSNSTRERLRQRSREAGILNSIGIVYNNLGQQQQALSFYQQALLIRREIGDSEGEAITLNNMGNVYADIGQLQQALNFYQQALPIRREAGNRSGEANILNNLGTVYTDIGQPQQALNYFQQALLIRREVGDQSGEAGTLNNIGTVYRNIEQPQQALSYYQQALPIIREVGDRNGEAKTLINIGNVYSKIGQPQQALNFYQQALPIRREVGDRAGEARTLSNIGSVYSDIGQLQLALNFYQQSLPLFREVSDRSGEANTLYNLSSVQQTLNDRPTALQNIQSAISIVEDIRGQLIDPDSRTSYFATVQRYYKLQIDLLMELHQKNPDQGYAAQAFNVTERSKARTLLELLTESKADIRTGVDPQLLQQERDMQTQLTALDKRRIELGNNREVNKEAIAALDTQRETLQTQYRNLQSQIRTTSPKYAALKYPQPLTLEQIQQQILDDNTVILSYSIGKDKSYLWLVSKNEMSSYQLPAGKILEDLATKKVRPQLTNSRTSQNSFVSNTSELSNILLKPVLEKTGNKRIVVIGDGALQYVPFGALPDPRADNNQYQPLLVNNEIVYLPSASTLQTLRNETQNRPTPPKTLAILADPVFTIDDPRVGSGSRSAPNPAELPLAAQNLETAARGARGGWSRLPGTRRESDTILKLVPSDQSLSLFDFQANRENALSNQLSQYRFIHWATHGFANTQKPELSGIVMSLVDQNGAGSNGYLLLEDIFNLSFNADLVVLSACETGLGEVVQGEGLIGLTRGLMYAGTPRVVTSLWAVPDSQTADLMGKFYAKMLQQNLRPAEALRAAQLEMFNSRNWVAPYYWAAFTLQGEWR
jgi:CHAT domain-containing protein/tetratricopeptide (TPR) repeat protein